jgi:hypothetical protein
MPWPTNSKARSNRLHAHNRRGEPHKLSPAMLPAVLQPALISIFDSALPGKLEAKWLFPQGKATLHNLQMATSESKMLNAPARSGVDCHRKPGHGVESPPRAFTSALQRINSPRRTISIKDERRSRAAPPPDCEPMKNISENAPALQCQGCARSNLSGMCPVRTTSYPPLPPNFLWGCETVDAMRGRLRRSRPLRRNIMIFNFSNWCRVRPQRRSPCS